MSVSDPITPAPVTGLVMFADLRGSTALFEGLGNARATELVTTCVDRLIHIIKEADGRVVKTLGDGLMAVFAKCSDAVLAADDMHDSIERLSLGPRGMHPSTSLKLQVAMAHGELLDVGGDCFGDAVNVAARLLDLTGDNETLLTEHVYQSLEGTLRHRAHSLSRMQLRGRAEPVHAYRLETLRRSELSDTTTYSALKTHDQIDVLRLTWLDQSLTFTVEGMPVVLGRSPQATFCIDDSRVSRSHARIESHGGAFQLADLSYNGSFVKFDRSTDVIALRRGTCTLHGSGVIGLGAPPSDISAPLLRFEVIKGSDPIMGS